MTNTRQLHQLEQMGALAENLASAVISPFYRRLVESGVTDRAATVLAGRLQDALVAEMFEPSGEATSGE